MNSDQSAAVEKRAKEIFSRERKEGETWTTVAPGRQLGKNTNVSSIGETRREVFRSRAREELRNEHG